MALFVLQLDVLARARARVYISSLSFPLLPSSVLSLSLSLINSM